MAGGGPLDSAVTLEEVIILVGAKRVPMAAELAGYLALEILEEAKNIAGDVDSQKVFISEEGTVAVIRTADGTGDCEASVRQLLGQLLSLGGSQTPALIAAAQRTERQGAGKDGGRSLAEELEAALIPVNRAAGRRALARLSREVKRITLGIGRNAAGSTMERRAPGAFASEPPTKPSAGEAKNSTELNPPSVRPPNSTEAAAVDDLLHDRQRDDVDDLLSSFSVSQDEAALTRDLKHVAGMDPTPPPPEQRKDTPVPPKDLAALIAESVPTRSPASTVSNRPPPSQERTREPSENRDRGRPPPATGALPPREYDLPAPGPKRGTLDRVLLLAFVALLLIAAVLVWQLKPGFISGRTPERIEQEKAEASARAQRPVPKACKTVLRVKDIPKDAEVLLRKGQAPLDISNLQAGVRLELVATAEGYAPKRTVVTPQMWEKGTDGKPRAEAPVQLDHARAKAGAVDPWPAGEPGTQIGGSGQPGTVHVVSSPRGAEIWLLVGLNSGSSEATVEQPGCSGDIDLLVAGPGVFRKRISVKETDFTATTDARSINVSAR